jgi:serine phosphatase RsbU (regulator of sigma subunit)
MGEGHALPEVLARADRYLTGELGDGYATVVVCRYEHATGELAWAKAGHEPPIVAGQPDAEEPGASPLGFGFGDGWPQFSRPLAPGERICLFTDGLIEARVNDGDQLGRAHLKSLVERGMSAPELVAQIQADADECPDDLAAVVISRAPAVTAQAAPVAPAAETDERQPATV